MSWSNPRLDYDPYVYWEFERGWVQYEGDQEIYFWEPLPISLGRYAMDPTSDRAGSMVLVQLGLLTAMNVLTLSLSGQIYRSMTGLVIQAYTGYTIGQLSLAAAPAVISVGAAIGYEQSVNKMVRDAHGGADIDWRGPYASGFGSVV